MPNLNYLMRVVRGARFDKMKPILETVKEKSGHSKARTFLSILWCSVRYGAGYYDYAMFGFYAMNGRQRDTYLTRMRNKKVLQAMNDYSYAEEFDDKNRFNKRFAPYLRRRTLKLGYDLSFGGKAHDPVGDFVGVGLRPFGNFSPRGENRCGGYAVFVKPEGNKQRNKHGVGGAFTAHSHRYTRFFRLGYYIFYRSQN